MSQPTPAQIRIKSAMARKVIRHHFGSASPKLEFKPAGKTNFVFEASTKSGDVIIRIARERGKIQDFHKEQWAVEKVKSKGIPVAQILEVGNEIIELPYMLQAKLKGTEAVDHPDRLKILEQLGEYAKAIHSIKTSGYGNVFDWSNNRLTKNKTWKEFMKGEFNAAGRIEVLARNEMLTKADVKKLEVMIVKAEKLNASPSLNHGDLRLKNVITNKRGKILAVIDWENCTSNLAPYWDLAIALHDLSYDAKEHFVKGYGIRNADLMKNAPYIKMFNILHYADAVDRMVKQKDKERLELYKLRMKGSMDIFSI